MEKFGSGRFRTKIAILLVASVLLCLGASFRVGINYKTPRPRDDPAGYQSKACFYIFNFTVEIIVIWLYFIVRVDRRFFIPNGSKGPGDYAGTNLPDAEDKDVKVATRIMSEEEVFDDAAEAPVQEERDRMQDVEKEAR